MITRIHTGRLTEKDLDRIIRQASRISSAGQRIEAISQHFLGTSYRESTLKGDMQSPEELVVDLEGVDCFTFLDYVEAMRLAGSFADFLSCLRRVRYRGGIVSYGARNHFFTDWAVHNASFVRDVTAEIGEGRAVSVRKRLNRKEDGSFFLEGIEPEDRAVTYLPPDALDAGIVARLRTGDYAGIFTEREGLDVSHVGIILRAGGVLMLRHASSDAGAVIDQEAAVYLKGRQGLVILRPSDVPGEQPECCSGS
jgi:hypothetical protein